MVIQAQELDLGFPLRRHGKCKLDFGIVSELVRDAMDDEYQKSNGMREVIPEQLVQVKLANGKPADGQARTHSG